MANLPEPSIANMFERALESKQQNRSHFPSSRARTRFPFPPTSAKPRRFLSSSLQGFGPFVEGSKGFFLLWGFKVFQRPCDRLVYLSHAMLYGCGHWGRWDWVDPDLQMLEALRRLWGSGVRGFRVAGLRFLWWSPASVRSQGTSKSLQMS